MKKILLLTMLTSFLSCQSAPSNIETTLVHDQYRIVIPAPVDIGGKLYISYEEIVCEKRLYKISPEFIGPLDKFKPLPGQACTAIIGNKPTPYVKTVNLMEYVRSEIPSCHQD